MREYEDDNIRLYTPVLQRIIILVAVIIAVPVVMWTITTMIRTYVAQPKAPTFRRMAETQPADTAAIAPPAVPAMTTPAAQAQTAAPTARLADAGAMASDARTPLLEIKRPAAKRTEDEAATGSAVPSQSAPASPSVAPASAAAAIPAALPPTMSARQVKTAAAEPISAPPPAQATPDPGPAPAVSATPIQSANAMQVADNGHAAPAAAGGGNKIVWPNPNATTPPTMGANSDTANRPTPSGSTTAPPTAAASPSNEAGRVDLPPGEPIAGRVPLPPHRPMLFAMVQTAIPLPRPRPTDAPAAAPNTPPEAPASSYDPGMQQGNY